MPYVRVEPGSNRILLPVETGTPNSEEDRRLRWKFYNSVRHARREALRQEHLFDDHTGEAKEDCPECHREARKENSNGHPHTRHSMV